MLRTSQILAISCALLANTALSPADSITLRQSIRLTGGASAVLLRDVADLEGAEALAFADVEVGRAPAGRLMEISVADVRRALDDAGAHWGKVNLNGRSVMIRPGRDPVAAAPLAMTPVDIQPIAIAQNIDAGRDERLASEMAHQPTVRGAIANLIISHVRIDPGDLQLGFDRADNDLLDTQTVSARFEIQPLGNLNGDRIEMTVRLWQGGKVQRSSNVSLTPMRRIRAAILRDDVDKDQMITEMDVIEAEHWLPPSQAAQTVNRVSAIGRIATKRMKAGEVVREKSIRREVMIKRGDLVTVRCLVGGAVIALQAEARAEGGEGDTIEFRKQGERDTFQATITGRSEAVVDLTRRERTLQ
jgi:flagella basal body P-ring formation protein FlgA